MTNRVVLVGRLARDADMRSTQSGITVAMFTLAVNRNFKTKNGEQQADFISCVAWRKTAEVIQQYTRKGSQIAVDGSLQTRTYDNKQGTKVYVTEVNVEQITLLGSKNDSGGQRQGYQSKQQNNGAQDPFNVPRDSIDISDDDLPF